MTKEEKTLLGLMFEILRDEAEYCFDLSYNDDPNWSVHERVIGFMRAVSSIGTMTPEGILKHWDKQTYEFVVENVEKKEDTPYTQICAIRVDAFAGSTIDGAVAECIRLSNVIRRSVTLNFNGVNLLINKYDNEAVIVSRYYTSLREKAEAKRRDCGY